MLSCGCELAKMIGGPSDTTEAEVNPQVTENAIDAGTPEAGSHKPRMSTVDKKLNKAMVLSLPINSAMTPGMTRPKKLSVSKI